MRLIALLEAFRPTLLLTLHWKEKVFDALPIEQKHSYTAGTILQSSPSTIDVAVADGFIRVIDLQVQGRKRMKTSAFLNGFTLHDTDVFK